MRGTREHSRSQLQPIALPVGPGRPEHVPLREEVRSLVEQVYSLPSRSTLAEMDMGENLSRTTLGRYWYLLSTAMVIAVYLAPGVVAWRWWDALGGDISLWGIEIGALDRMRSAPHSAAPINWAAISGTPAAIICVFARSPLVHATLLPLPAYLAYWGIFYINHGRYFGCDRNGCSAEDTFIIVSIFTAVISVVIAGVSFMLWVLLRDYQDRRSRSAWPPTRGT